ncbi:MAG: hypothetical protein WEB88_09955 [Gemmatimonadota bacterium]
MLPINVQLLASVLPAGPLEAPDAARPVCSAELSGNVMITEIRFSDGYTVSAPWHIVRREANVPYTADSPRRVAMVLDRIEERSAHVPMALVTAFDRPILATFEGRTDDEIVYHAAQAWCATVIRSHMAGHRSFTPAPHEPMRITARTAERAYALSA